MTTRPRGGIDPAVVFGLLLVIVGGAFLLRNAGVVRIDWDVLWPLLLIGLGLVVFAGAWQQSRGGSASVSRAGAWQTSGGGERTGRVSVSRDGASRLELALRVGAGRYRLGADRVDLVEVSSAGDDIESRLDRQGDLARVRLNPATTSWWPFGTRFGVDWRIAVAPELPTMIDLQGGAGEFDLDLSELSIAGASITIGAAQLRVVLPRPRGDVPIRVEGGAASFQFDVPAGIEARIAVSGLVSTSGPTETSGYAGATDRVTVTVSGGAASVRVIPLGG